MAETLTLRQQKHRDIVAAAQIEFMERGFANVSMDAIATRASVSKRTLYNHFPSKDDLFQQISRDLLAQSKGRLRLDYDPSKSLDEQLRAVAELQFDLCQDECFIRSCRMVLPELLSSPEHCNEALQEAKWSNEPLIDWLQAAQADGRIAPCDLKTVAHLFRSMIDGMFFWPHVIGGRPWPEGMDRDVAINAAVAMFKHLIAR